MALTLGLGWAIRTARQLEGALGECRRKLLPEQCPGMGKNESEELDSQGLALVDTEGPAVAFTLISQPPAAAGTAHRGLSVKENGVPRGEWSLLQCQGSIKSYYVSLAQV